MKFQPGQSGNPAGRPLGSRNKKTIAVEELLAEQAEAAVKNILRRADGGCPIAKRFPRKQPEQPDQQRLSEPEHGAAIGKSFRGAAGLCQATAGFSKRRGWSRSRASSSRWGRRRRSE